jgi:hypothetical protein
MAFVKLDKPTPEWVNLAYAVKVDIAGDADDRSVRVWLEGEPVPAVVASGLSDKEAELEAGKLVEDTPREAPASRGPVRNRKS